ELSSNAIGVPRRWPPGRCRPYYLPNRWKQREAKQLERELMRLERDERDRVRREAQLVEQRRQDAARAAEETRRRQQIAAEELIAGETPGGNGISSRPQSRTSGERKKISGDGKRCGSWDALSRSQEPPEPEPDEPYDPSRLFKFWWQP